MMIAYLSCDHLPRSCTMTRFCLVGTGRFLYGSVNEAITDRPVVPWLLEPLEDRYLIVTLTINSCCQ